MKLDRRGKWATAIKRAMATIAIVSQLLLVFAPLVELHDGGLASQPSASRTAMAGVGLLAGQRSQVPQHNAATCPACIAQSLHAVLQSAVRVPTVAFAEYAVVDHRAAVLLQSDLPSTHHSRAPPVVN